MPVPATVICGIVFAELASGGTSTQWFLAMRAANDFFKWKLRVNNLFDLLPFWRLFVMDKNLTIGHFNNELAVICLVE